MSSFYVLDLDRTLVDTDKLYKVLETVLERDTPIKIDQLYTARAKIEVRGESFSVARHIRSLLEELRSEVTWQDVQAAFIHEALRADMLEPYAKELLQVLDEKNLPYGIITYGTEAWQLAKIEASGLDNVPHLVTRIKEKGLLLAGWQRADRLFIIPPAMTRDFIPLVVDSIIFLDDKAVSFKNIPVGVRGVFVTSPTGELLSSQRGALPVNVATVVGLDSAIQLLLNDKY